MYYSDKVTDEKLKKLENRISSMYKSAYEEMTETANAYFKKFEERYVVEYNAYQRGEYTELEFNSWVRTQIARGKGYEEMSNQLAKRMTEANKVASAYINDDTPSIYSLNRDYEAYRIEKAYNLDYHLTDETTVRRLMGNDNHIEFKTTSINTKKDYEWNRKEIHKALTVGILQGKSIDKLADSYYAVMKRNRASAIRNARTSYTSAQNAGRVEAYYRADNMGINLTKEWIATYDERTRTSHAMLNGNRVEYDKLFSNGLMYPADPEGAPAEVYNCRCTLRAVLPNINDKTKSKPESNTGKRIETDKIAGSLAGTKTLVYNKNAIYNIELEGYNKNVSNGINEACRRVVEASAIDNVEHGIFVSLKDGTIIDKFMNDEAYFDSIGGEATNKFIYSKENKNKSYAFVHSHLTEGAYSEIDMVQLLSENCVDVFVTAQIDGVQYTCKKKDTPKTFIFDDLYSEEIKNIDKTRTSDAQRAPLREALIVRNLIRDYTEGLIKYE